MGKEVQQLLETSLPIEYQNFRLPRNQRLIQQKVGSAHDRLSTTIPAGRYSGQGQVVKFHLASVFGLVSERPVFKTWAVGLNLCPPRSGHCTGYLEAGVGSTHYSKFTVTRTVSSGCQLVVLELRKWHVLIIIHDKSSSTMRVKVQSPREPTH